jgi:large subunit ribosomal protein L49
VLLPAVARTLATVARSDDQGSEHAQEAQPGRSTAYFVPRNTNGAIPVYTDQVNTKYMTLIRNVQGDVNALTTDLKKTLFKPDSPEARRLKIETRQQRHVVLSGGKWKREVFEWLKARGY